MRTLSQAFALLLVVTLSACGGELRFVGPKTHSAGNPGQGYEPYYRPRPTPPPLPKPEDPKPPSFPEPIKPSTYRRSEFFDYGKATGNLNIVFLVHGSADLTKAGGYWKGFLKSVPEMKRLLRAQAGDYSNIAFYGALDTEPTSLITLGDDPRPAEFLGLRFSLIDALTLWALPEKGISDQKFLDSFPDLVKGVSKKQELTSKPTWLHILYLRDMGIEDYDEVAERVSLSKFDDALRESTNFYRRTSIHSATYYWRDEVRAIDPNYAGIVGTSEGGRVREALSRWDKQHYPAGTEKLWNHTWQEFSTNVHAFNTQIALGRIPDPSEPIRVKVGFTQQDPDDYEYNSRTGAIRFKRNIPRRGAFVEVEYAVRY